MRKAIFHHPKSVENNRKTPFVFTSEDEFLCDVSMTVAAKMLDEYYKHFQKIISHIILYYLSRFHRLIAFTSPDIAQYVYYNYLFPSLGHHKF